MAHTEHSYRTEGEKGRTEEKQEEIEGGICGGDYKHLLLAKFRQDITQQEMDDLIRGYTSLVFLSLPSDVFAGKLRHSPLFSHFINTVTV